MSKYSNVLHSTFGNVARPSIQQHTPGPWHVVYYNNKAEETVASIVTKDGSKCVCDIPLGGRLGGYYEGPKSNRNDAHLVAAAPDMLQTLILMSDGINTLIDHSEEWSSKQSKSHLEELQSVICATITKAT